VLRACICIYKEGEGINSGRYERIKYVVSDTCWSLVGAMVQVR
jgi:hypothetical protein